MQAARIDELEAAMSSVTDTVAMQVTQTAKHFVFSSAGFILFRHHAHTGSQDTRLGT